MNYDQDVIRFQLLEVLSHSNGSYGVSLHRIHQVIYEKYKGNASPDLHETLLDLLYLMIAEGLARPETRSSDRDSTIRWGYFELTTFGKQLLKDKGEHPHFVEEYLSRISQISTVASSLDSVIEFYVKESLELNRIGRYTPSVVMLGVASERAIDLLCDAVLDSLKPDSREKFQKVVNGRSMKVKVDELYKKIEAVTLPDDLKDGLSHIIWGFVTILRKHRNDFGHPSAVVATRDDALSYLQCFPQYLKRIYMLIEYYQNTTRGKVEEVPQ